MTNSGNIQSFLFSVLQAFKPSRLLHNIILLISCCWGQPTQAWGFFAHKQINRHAVLALPGPLIGFYKAHIHYLTTRAVTPDKRRGIVLEEAARHYIDLEHYGEKKIANLPRHMRQAQLIYGEDALQTHGLLPWHIVKMKKSLTRAFRQKDIQRILKLSADVGHYIADANVPLHTTCNYNGQFTQQEGIHGLWETHIPEKLWGDFDLWVGPATYISDITTAIWKAIEQAHHGVDRLLRLEKQLSQDHPWWKQYTFEQRGTTLTKTYTPAYVVAYHTRLEHQVGIQLRASIKMVRDFWYTCWVDAECPDLQYLGHTSPSKDSTEAMDELTPSYHTRTCNHTAPT